MNRTTFRKFCLHGDNDESAFKYFCRKHRKMKNTFCFFMLSVFLLCCSLPILAQEKPEDVTKQFFELFESKGSDAAVDYVFATNKWLNSDQTTIDNIKAQLKKGIAIIGQYYGFELAERKTLGESFILLSYILRYDRQPIMFTFILYKPNDKWQIQNLKFDDRLDDNIVED